MSALSCHRQHVTSPVRVINDDPVDIYFANLIKWREVNIPKSMPSYRTLVYVAE